MTLKELYKEIIRNPKEWDYYNGVRNGNEFSIEDLAKPDKCEKFISKFMTIAKKHTDEFQKYVNALLDSDAEKTRLCHIVSTFFLGIALYQENYIKEKIDKEIKDLKILGEGVKIEEQFPFIWFLLCMYHDLGYVFEKEITSKQIKEDDLASEKKKLIQTMATIKKDSTPDYYSEIIYAYLRYRGGKDHGVLGGLAFVKYITDLRDEVYTKTKDEGWKPELDKLYEYVGWCICCHNVWYVRLGEDKFCDVLEYAVKGLSPLILNCREERDQYVEYPIHFEEHPLFFLFSFVDSIEPVKKSKDDKDLDKLLEGVEIDVSSTGEIKFNIREHQEYQDCIKSLNSWLVHVKDRRRCLFSDHVLILDI